VARALSLDHDGEGFLEIGRRDPVVGRLQAAAPRLRPPLFYSPYEAAAWAVISARRPAAQMAEVRRELSEAHGVTFELAGRSVAAFPTPEALLQMEAFPGINAQKMERLHDVANAALAGRLDAERIRAMDPDAAMADLQTIKGIGPFYSMLILIRASGHADVLPVGEPRLLESVGRLYGLPGPPSEEELRVIAEAWMPFRTWTAVLIRAASERAPAQQVPAPRPQGTGRPACPVCGSTRTQPFPHAGPAARVNMKCTSCGHLFKDRNLGRA
jgi:DNA-3-methyladenine glycosylase II